MSASLLLLLAALSFAQPDPWSDALMSPSADKRAKLEAALAKDPGAVNGYVGLSAQNREYNKKTALHGAAGFGDLETARWLLDHGAAVDPKDREGETPLHDAALHDHALLCDLLLSRGAKVDERTESGSTALILASVNANVETVRVLLTRGADPNAVTRWGVTSLAEAKRAVNPGKPKAAYDMTVALLEQYGAKDPGAAAPPPAAVPAEAAAGPDAAAGAPSEAAPGASEASAAPSAPQPTPAPSPPSRSGKLGVVIAGVVLIVLCLAAASVLRKR